MTTNWWSHENKGRHGKRSGPAGYSKQRHKMVLRLVRNGKQDFFYITGPLCPLTCPICTVTHQRLFCCRMTCCGSWRIWTSTNEEELCLLYWTRRASVLHSALQREPKRLLSSLNQSCLPFIITVDSTPSQCLKPDRWNEHQVGVNIKLLPGKFWPGWGCSLWWIISLKFIQLFLLFSPRAGPFKQTSIKIYASLSSRCSRLQQPEDPDHHHPSLPVSTIQYLPGREDQFTPHTIPSAHHF